MSADAPTRPSSSGNLTKTPLAHLFVYAFEKRLSGTFELTCPSGEAATVTVVNGLVAKVRTNKPVAYLGAILYELGFIDDAELNESLAEMVSRRVLHGRVLLERGSITKEQLAMALREQTLRKLAHLFAFAPETTFIFEPDTDALVAFGGDDAEPLDPFPAIWRGVREYPSDEHVRTIVARVGDCRCRLATNADITRFDLQGDELTAAEALSRSALSIGELSLAEAFGQRRAELLVYCLLITKQVEFVHSVAPSKTLTPPEAFRPSGVEVAARARAISFNLRTATPSAPPKSSPPRSSPPRSPAFQRLNEELATRRQTIRDRAKAIPKEDFYQRLGLTRDATAEDADRAFNALRTLWDPSALSPMLEDVRDDCWLVLSSMAEAHSTLIDPLKTIDYHRVLKCGSPLLRDLYAEDLEASGAESDLGGAKACFAKKDYDRAERLARRAHRADKDCAESLALLAWLEAMKPANQSPEATKVRIAMLDVAIMKDDKREEPYFWRAQLHKRLDHHAAAMRDFKHVVKMNDKHLDAVRELRLYEMRVRHNSLSMRAVTPSKGTPTGLLAKLRA